MLRREAPVPGPGMNAERGSHIDIFFSQADGCFVANVPALRYCSAFGDSPAEALSEVRIAEALYLKSCQRRGDPVPPATYRPIIYQAAIGA